MNTYIILKSNVEKKLTKIYRYYENKIFRFTNKVRNSSNSENNIRVFQSIMTKISPI